MWHASYLASIDDWHVGVRSDDPDATRQLELLLGDLLSESPDPPSGYGVVTLPRVAGTRSQPLAELRHGPRVVLRSRYTGRLTAAAASHVRALGYTSQPVLRLAFSLVSRKSVGVMVHPQLLRMPGLEPLLVRAGWDITDTPELAVNTHDDAVADVISWSSQRSDARTSSVTLRSIVVPDNTIDHGSSRSAILGYLMSSSPPSTLAPQEHLDRAAQLASKLRIVSASGAEPRAVAAALAQALSEIPSGNRWDDAQSPRG